MKSALLILLILAIPFISAWPMELLPNGTIIDLGTNETINGTSVDFMFVNDTLFIVPAGFTNITYSNITYENNTYNMTNVTNITYSNVTIGNLTNYTTQNITLENYTYFYYYNGTGNFTYNKTEIDSKLGTYVLTSELVLKTELNDTSTRSYVGTTTFWVMWILLVVIIITAVAGIMMRE